ncbi:MAG: 3-deoxy-D-manno-octulosonate 8-phosphate phosphatase [Bacteroidetes bacterium]|nr:3-deoxy-D-manno-octulosonate 8-phosphate phosphatase [Bacteroidota bacterium]
MAAKKLSAAEIKRRARKIKLVLTDVDGVLTDTGVYYSENGEVMKRFSIRDGMGVELMRDRGIETAIITREKSPSVKKRGQKLKMPWIFLGIWSKVEFIPTILQKTGLQMDELAYIGDDVNDLEIIQEIAKHGLTATPGDGMPVIKREVHYIAQANAGYGAFRDFADWLLAMRE